MNQNTENMSLKEALVYIKALKDENERLKQQNANLTEQIIRNQKKMFGKSSEQIRYIYHHATCSGKVVEKILGDYSKYLQTDGCASYNAAVKAIHIGCLAHARRKWTDCLPKGIDDKNSKAAQALELIERIFAADKGLEGMPENDRRTKALKPLLDKYWKLLETIDASKGSGIYKAMLYSVNQKEQLTMYFLTVELNLPIILQSVPLSHLL